MKVMKARRVTKVAKGRLAKALVFRGSKEKTVGGLKQDSLMKNKRGKIVSKKSSAQGKRRYSKIEGWVEPVMEARQSLHVKGFVAINSKSLTGQALYVKSKKLYEARHGKRATVTASPSRPSVAPSPSRPSLAA